MAETLNLGNGNWATKEDSLLAYNSENGNFKPLPFDFTRASSATVVNKAGLIETVGSGEPRIDFNNDAKGALLLEPTRSNLITYSEDFLSGAWTKESSTIVADSSISPDGNLNATKLTSNTSSGLIRASYNSSIGVDHTFSFFIKNDNSLSSDITIRTSSTAVNSTINWTNNVLTSITNGTGVTDFESYGNGWYRVFTSYESIEAEQRCKIYASRNGDGASVYIYGAMIEQGSYATSYIPTQGQSGGVTRVADSISINLPDTDSFNSSNGFSLITEFGAGAAGSGSSSVFLTVNDDTSSTYMGFTSSSVFRSRLNLSGTAYLNSQGNAPRTQVNSLFISCDSNGWAQGANGVVNDTGINDASVFNKVNNINCVTTESYGIIKINKLLIYNTRLSNAELAALTSN